MLMMGLFSNFAYNAIALRKAKIVYNFGLSECNNVKAYEGELVHFEGAQFTFSVFTTLVN